MGRSAKQRHRRRYRAKKEIRNQAAAIEALRGSEFWGVLTKGPSPFEKLEGPLFPSLIWRT